MKTNEIMVGDWLSLGETPIRVNESLFLSGHLTDDYKPIPLTPEILRKNGFEKYNDLCYFDFGYYIDGFHIVHKSEKKYLLCDSFYSDDNGHYNALCEIKYVHQLQHALRLCGLNELADKFEI